MIALTEGQNVTEAIAGELRAAAARTRKSQTQIATELGVSQMWINRRLSGQVDITVRDLVRLCSVLDLDSTAILSTLIDP